MRDLRAIGLAAWLTASLAGCGGGSGQVADGGIGGSGISRGSVTDISSITVNGRRLATTSGAQIRINGRSGTLSEVDPGHVVRVEADFDDDEALTVHFRPELQGRVDARSVGNGTGTLTVLGHPVVVDQATIIAGFADLAAINVGDRVQVSGFATGDGAVRATRIESTGDATDRLVATMHDPGLAGDDTLRMGGLTVDHSNASSVSFPGGEPSAGDHLVVAGTLDNTDGVFQADVIEPAVLIGGSPGDSVVVTGIAQSIAGSDAVALADHALDLGDADIEGGTRADLRNGRRLRVQGVLRPDQRIDVTRVTIDP